MKSFAGVTASGLNKSFGEKLIWSDVSFQVASGQVVTITGPSGAGKTTLLNCVGMLEPFDGGSLRVGDTDLATVGGRGRRLYFQRDVGFLFQNYGLVESWTVDRNLDLALAYSPLSRRSRQIAKSEALEQVNLPLLGRQKIATLSGGEQQRIALARLILKEPKLILADEPSSALDDDNVVTVFALLRELSEGGAAVIISTHDKRIVNRSDAQIVLG